MARHGNNSLVRSLRARKLKNAVVREVCDQEGYKLALIIQPHDGTEAGIVAAAQTATDRMYTEFAAPSSVESRICATDPRHHSIKDAQLPHLTLRTLELGCRLAGVWSADLGDAKN